MSEGRMVREGGGWFVAWGRGWLVHPWLPLILAVVSLALVLPALRVGWQLDDYIHRLALLGPSRKWNFPADLMPSGRATELFRFTTGDPQRNGRLMALGGLPWWTLPEMRVGFFRPLTALTHQLDYRLWPNSAVLMHAHSLVWFAVLVFVVAQCYRRLLGRTATAGLAALFYGLDATHGPPVGWIANRNVLPAAVFGVLAVMAYDRWRRDGWRFGALAAPVLLALSLLSGEAGVATLAYLLAYALCLDRAPGRARVFALLPCVALAVVWRVVWVAMGFGVYGVGGYIDPGTEPLRFAAAVVRRGPLLVLGQWSPVPADVGLILTPQGYPLFWAGAVVVCLLVAGLLFPLARRDPTARFFAVGLLLALLPVCATFPSDRLLVFADLGAMGLLAQVLTALFLRDRLLPTARWWRHPAWTLAGVLLLVHGVLSPLQLPGRAASRIGPDSFYVQVPFDTTVAGQSVVIVNGPSAYHALLMPVIRAVQGLPVPRYNRVLFPSFAGMQITRTDAHTLVLRPAGGYIGFALDRLDRDSTHPMRQGDRIALPELTITVTAMTEDGRPAEIACRFAVPLEDRSLRWLCWQEGRYAPFTPPAIGASIALPPAVPGIHLPTVDI